MYTAQEIEKIRQDAARTLFQEYREIHPEEYEPGRSASSAPPEFDDSERGSADGNFKVLHDAIHRRASPRMALCLSGGGIRSATFSLGVLQGLAKEGWLRKFHYLSTVSGGGYIGSWLSSWIAREEGGLSAVETKLHQRSGTRSEELPVSRLRAYSNYLSPVWGLSLDFITLVVTFARNVLLNWFVLIPALIALLLIPRLNLSILWRGVGIGTVGFTSLFILACALASLAIAYIASDLPGNDPGAPAKDSFKLRCLVPFAASVLLLTWLWAWVAGGKVVLLPIQLSLTTPTKLCANSCSVTIGWWLFAFLVGAGVHIVGFLLGHFIRKGRFPIPDSGTEPQEPKPWYGARAFWTRAGTLSLVIISGGMATALMLWGASVFFPLSKGSSSGSNGLSPGLFATFGLPFVLVCIWLASNIYAAFTRVASTEGDREWWARASAWFLYVAGAWIVAHLLVIYVPFWALKQLDSTPAAVGGGFLGVIAGVVGYWSKSGLGRLAEKAKGVGSLIGARLLEIISLVFILFMLSGLALLSSSILKHSIPGVMAATEQFVAANYRAAASSTAEEVPAPTKQEQTKTALAASFYALFYTVPTSITFGAFIAMALFSWGSSAVVGANTFSMQSMYGNRLVRAYLGATRGTRSPHPFNGFDPADNIKVDKLKRRPFHIVNIALNMVMPSGNRLEWQQRKAASFIVSPLHSGSMYLGYRPSSEYAQGISLGRALSLSGAAASPNMGYHTSALVTFVLAFFNVRLGGWLPNPGAAGDKVWKKADPNRHGPSLIDEALGRTTDDQPYVYLSDGGHFENLGLYEMVYRRCDEIVVIDASCDAEYSYEDLENAIRKIRTDLGISIDFPDPLPSPAQSRRGHSHYSVGYIRYKDADGEHAKVGRLIYVKPVLSGDEPLDVRRYASLHTKEKDAFPHQSTADQFFDESQFESYRALGRHSAANLVSMRRPGLGEWSGVVPLVESSAAIEESAPAAAASAELAANDADEMPKGEGVAKEAATLLSRASDHVFSLNSLSGVGAAVAASFVLQGVIDKPKDEQPPPRTAQAREWPIRVPEPLMARVPVVLGGPVNIVWGDAVPAGDFAELPEVDITARRVGIDAGPIPPVVPPAARGPFERLVLPLFGEARGCKAGSVDCVTGTAPETYSQRYFKNLAEALVACASAKRSGGAGPDAVQIRNPAPSAEAGGQPEPAVKLVVWGFASSSPFKGAVDPDTKNMELANERATRVVKRLKDAVAAAGAGPDLIDIKPYVWASPALMFNGRRYDDKDENGDYLTARGRWNRRVEIVFSSMGVCSRSSLRSALQLAASSAPNTGG